MIDSIGLDRGVARQFLPFVLTSGVGWLIDLSVLLMLTGLTGATPFVANISSSLTASTLVYCIAHRSIYAARTAQIGRPLALYIAYSLGMILTTSWAVGRLVEALGGFPAPVLLAKVAVTPPLLLLNFIVSRALALGVRHG